MPSLKTRVSYQIIKLEEARLAFTAATEALDDTPVEPVPAPDDQEAPKP